MTSALWLLPAFPLVGALVLMVFGRRLGEPRSGWFAAAMPIASFLVTLTVYFDLLSRHSEDRREVITLFSWIPVGALHIDVALLADPLSITMALFITGIGSLIHLYAIGYMHGDPKFSKFFLYLNLFVFSMLMLVLGENLLVTFLGWEGVGACSYFLISFWHTRNSAAVAGKKAFVTNRIGDFGVMTAMFLAFSTIGSVSYSSINEAAHTGALAPVTAFKLVKDEATGSEMQKRSTKRRRCRSCRISRRSRRCRRSAEVRRCRRCRRKVYEKGACMWCMRRCAGVQRKEVRMSTLGIRGSPIMEVYMK